MTIEEIRKARTQAETDVREVMERFTQLTGVQIIACEVETMQVNAVGEPGPQTYLTAVRLTLDSI